MGGVAGGVVFSDDTLPIRGQAPRGLVRPSASSKPVEGKQWVSVVSLEGFNCPIPLEGALKITQIGSNPTVFLQSQKSGSKE